MRKRQLSKNVTTKLKLLGGILIAIWLGIGTIILLAEFIIFILHLAHRFTTIPEISNPIPSVWGDYYLLASGLFLLVFVPLFGLFLDKFGTPKLTKEEEAEVKFYKFLGYDLVDIDAYRKYKNSLKESGSKEDQDEEG